MLQVLTAGEASSFGDLAFLLVQSGYSRTAETEADIHGKNILTSVLVDTRPLAGFFERLIHLKRTSNDDDTDDEDANDEDDESRDTESADRTDADAADPNEKMTTDEDEDSLSERSFISWISTHPPTRDRIAYFNRSTITTNPPIMTAAEFKALKGICGEDKK